MDPLSNLHNMTTFQDPETFYARMSIECPVMEMNSNQCQSQKPVFTIKRKAASHLCILGQISIENHNNMHMRPVPSCTRCTVMKDVTPHSTLPSCLRVV